MFCTLFSFLYQFIPSDHSKEKTKVLAPRCSHRTSHKPGKLSLIKFSLKYNCNLGCLSNGHSPFPKSKKSPFLNAFLSVIGLKFGIPGQSVLYLPYVIKHLSIKSL